MGNYLGTYNVINSELKKNIGCEFTVTISPNEIRKKAFPSQNLSMKIK